MRSNSKASLHIYGVDIPWDFGVLSFDLSLIFASSFTYIAKSEGLLG
jgi:hypothetical protein